jgi:hypothetical protein
VSSLQPHHKTARHSLAFRAKGSDADASELAHSCVRLRWLNTPRALPLAKTSPAMRLFSDSAGSPSRPLGAHDSISEVPGGGRLRHPRACLIHKVLRFFQMGHCYPPRLDRTNRDSPMGVPWQQTGTQRVPGQGRRDDPQAVPGRLACGERLANPTL